MTSLLTVCQSHPNSSAASDTARPFRPTTSAAHRAARQVNNPRSGAIRASCSVNEPAPQATSRCDIRGGCPCLGEELVCFRQPSRTGRPNTGRSTSSTSLSPLDHTRPPQPGHNGREPPTVRNSTTSAPSRGSPTSSNSTPPNPANTLHMRLYLHSTRGPPSLGDVFSVRLWRTPPPNPRIPPPPPNPPLPPHFRRACNPCPGSSPTRKQVEPPTTPPRPPPTM